MIVKPVFYLIYVSSAVRMMGDDELLYLLEQSRDNNARLGVTGMLLYKSGNFMQMLEGAKQTVMDLYDTIKIDERHKDVYTILVGNTEEQCFQDWSMGFSNMDKLGDFPHYRKYIQKNLDLNSFQDDAQKAYRFMVQFNEQNR